MRRHDAQHDLGSVQGTGQVRRNIYMCRKFEAGEINIVHPRCGNAGGEVALVDPEANLRKARGEHQGECRTPASASDNRKILQRLLAPKEKTCSVPARSLRTFPLCL